MKQRHVLQIVPIAGRDGVGSFAVGLGEELEARGLRVETVGAVGGAAAGRDAVRDALSRRPGRSIILHYVGYGYHPRGCPFWLDRLLRPWRRVGDAQLIVVFHEVYATGRPWQSSFWLSPAMRSLARRLGNLADARVTSLARYREILGAWGLAAHELPVFSTVGEPPLLASWEDRRPRAVVFGSSGVRRRVWEKLPELERSCRELGITEILDIGPGEAGCPPLLDFGMIRRLGLLSGDGVSGILKEARAGVLAYPGAFLPKSTVFAAYAAHGLVPLLLPTYASSADSSVPAYWTGGGEPERARDVAARALAWYRAHNRATHGALYAGLLAR